MNEKSSHAPYRMLGSRLKQMRELAKETLADTSGAVEIDVKQLASYELGQARPAEDVLMLLISHFNAKEDEAYKLWELAGYAPNRVPNVIGINEELINEIAIPLLNPTPKILFTDTVDVIVNNYGVVMNFMQNSGSAGQSVSIAKVGMSREHAKSVLQILQATLAQTEKGVSGNVQKRLPKTDNRVADDTPNT